jgi:hypothetical protein
MSYPRIRCISQEVSTTSWCQLSSTRSPAALMVSPRPRTFTFKYYHPSAVTQSASSVSFHSTTASGTKSVDAYACPLCRINGWPGCNHIPHIRENKKKKNNESKTTTTKKKMHRGVRQRPWGWGKWAAPQRR